MPAASPRPSPSSGWSVPRRARAISSGVAAVEGMVVRIRRRLDLAPRAAGGRGTARGSRERGDGEHGPAAERFDGHLPRTVQMETTRDGRIEQRAVGVPGCSARISASTSTARALDALLRVTTTTPPGQRRRRLAPGPAGEEARRGSSPRPRRGRRPGPAQPPVLEAVVQHHHVAPGLDRRPRAFDPPRRGEDRDPGFHSRCSATSSAPYPRSTTAGRRPHSASRAASHAATGVFPAPPTARFPTLTTGTPTRLRPIQPRSNPAVASPTPARNASSSRAASTETARRARARLPRPPAAHPGVQAHRPNAASARRITSAIRRSTSAMHASTSASRATCTGSP
jgi:hypothetical protein